MPYKTQRLERVKYSRNRQLGVTLLCFPVHYVSSQKSGASGRRSVAAARFCEFRADRRYLARRIVSVVKLRYRAS